MMTGSRRKRRGFIQSSVYLLIFSLAPGFNKHASISPPFWGGENRRIRIRLVELPFFWFFFLGMGVDQHLERDFDEFFIFDIWHF